MDYTAITDQQMYNYRVDPIGSHAHNYCKALANFLFSLKSSQKWCYTNASDSQRSLRQRNFSFLFVSVQLQHNESVLQCCILLQNFYYNRTFIISLFLSVQLQHHESMLQCCILLQNFYYHRIFLILYFSLYSCSTMKICCSVAYCCRIFITTQLL